MQTLNPSMKKLTKIKLSKSYPEKISYSFIGSSTLYVSDDLWSKILEVIKEHSEEIKVFQRKEPPGGY